MPYEIMTISSFYAHLFTVSEKKCEADSEKQHARLPSAGRRDIYRYRWWFL